MINTFEKGCLNSFQILITTIVVILSSFSLFGQEKSLTDKVAEAVNQLEYLHFKTRYYHKYYTSNDTTIYDAETWVHKTPDDTVLGMHIRNVRSYNDYLIETIHKGTTSWIIHYSNDTITEYDQAKGHWDGFSGNIMSSYTTEIPLVAGIDYTPEDSIDIVQLENGNWIIHHVTGDVPEYSVTRLEDWLHVDGKTFLPFRAELSWFLDGKQTYEDLHIELLETDKKTVTNGLNKTMPDFPVIKFETPERIVPLEVGTKAPSLEGQFAESSNKFELADYLDNHLVLLDFWYESCAPCIRAIPYIDSLVEEYKDKGLILFSANSHDKNKDTKTLLDFVESRGGDAESVVFIDLKTEREVWGCYGNPFFYLIKNGEIVWVQGGFSPEMIAELREIIEKTLSKE